MPEPAAPELADDARYLLELHTAPEILVLANVWDVVSARVVAATDGVRALATASHSIASTFGYEDGENIPLNLHLDMVGLIVAAVDLPVTMDFEAGYGDPAETTRRAIEIGVVGGNLEDQMKPLEEAVDAVEAALRAGWDAGIDFVLNARTDVFLRAEPGTPGTSCSPRRSAGAEPTWRSAHLSCSCPASSPRTRSRRSWTHWARRSSA